ncbi:MAG: HigA family addiction module antidote protein [Deltaproteobacteria bacterium]|nr:HigA family addiction module antidote protein [Deltaproteobacteria bacterium]
MLPKNRPPSHPGEILLKDFLEPLEITQSKLANYLQWPYARLNEIIKGKRGITVESALVLGEALNTGPQFWLNLQQNWDLWHSLKEHKSIKPLKEFKDHIVQ